MTTPDTGADTFDVQIRNLTIGVARAYKAGDSAAVAWLIKEIGICFYDEAATSADHSRMLTAAEHFAAAAQLFTDLGQDADAAGCLLNLGMAHHKLGSLPQAAQAWAQAAEINTRLGRDQDSAQCWTNLGVVLHRLGQLEPAEQAHLRAVELFTRLNQDGSSP